MGNYIADFVAHSCNLVVEVDGESHDFEERLRKDETRDEWFASRGYRVLRFTNDDVMKNLEGVARAILQAAEPGAPPSLTLPRKGGGNGESGGGRQIVLPSVLRNHAAPPIRSSFASIPSGPCVAATIIPPLAR